METTRAGDTIAMEDFWTAPQEPERLRVEREKRERIERNRERRRLMQRAIKHPLFRNCLRPGAEQYLADKEVGEVVIRPSSKGADHVTITVKFYEGRFMHILVQESGKVGGTSDLSLGTELRIPGWTDDVYEDLDELQARFILPMVDNATALHEHPKFVAGGREATIAVIKDLKKAQPASLPYRFCVSYKHQGFFELIFQQNETPRKFLLKATQAGFSFVAVFNTNTNQDEKHRVHPTVAHLISYFKRQFYWLKERDRAQAARERERQRQREREERERREREERERQAAREQQQYYMAGYQQQPHPSQQYHHFMPPPPPQQQQPYTSFGY
jgi:transcription elongation factor SPT6